MKTVQEQPALNKKLNSNFITITAGFQHNNIHCQPTHDYYVFILAENMYTEIRSNSMSVSTFYPFCKYAGSWFTISRNQNDGGVWFPSPLIVTDNWLTKSGMVGNVQKVLEEHGIFSVIYDGPSLTQPQKMLQQV